MAINNNIWKKASGIAIAPIQTGPGQVFTDYTVAVKTTDQTTGQDFLNNLPGFTFGGTGLGYYPNPANGKEYIPVHLPTGFTLSNPLTLENCQSYLREIAGKVDWHRVGDAGPPDKVMADLVTIEKKYISTSPIPTGTIVSGK